VLRGQGLEGGGLYRRIRIQEGGSSGAEIQGTSSALGGTPDLLPQPEGGAVAIGLWQPQCSGVKYLCKLSVGGSIATKEIVVTLANLPDYVFDPDYQLSPLSDVGAYIQEHHHLQDIPPDSEDAEKGVSLGDMQAKLLEKVEELTLYMIQADERNTRLEQQNRELQQRVARLEARGIADQASETQ